MRIRGELGDLLVDHGVDLGQFTSSDSQLLRAGRSALGTRGELAATAGGSLSAGSQFLRTLIQLVHAIGNARLAAGAIEVAIGGVHADAEILEGSTESGGIGGLGVAGGSVTAGTLLLIGGQCGERGLGGGEIAGCAVRLLGRGLQGAIELVQTLRQRGGAGAELSDAGHIGRGAIGQLVQAQAEAVDPVGELPSAVAGVLPHRFGDLLTNGGLNLGIHLIGGVGQVGVDRGLHLVDDRGPHLVHDRGVVRGGCHCRVQCCVQGIGEGGLVGQRVADVHRQCREQHRQQDGGAQGAADLAEEGGCAGGHPDVLGWGCGLGCQGQGLHQLA